MCNKKKDNEVCDKNFVSICRNMLIITNNFKQTNATVSEINRGWRGVSSAKRIHPPISLWALQVYNFKDKLHCL